MKIILYIIKHERDWAWQAMKMNIERLQEVHPFKVVVAGDVTDCEDFHKVETKNKPLGEKRQRGLEYIKDLNPDYVIFSGMDHLISNSLFKTYLQFMKDGCEYIGFTDLYFFDKETKKLYYSWGYTNNRMGEPQGTWRTLSKEALEKCDWKLYDEKTIHSLDKTFTNNTKKLKLTSFTLREHGLVAIDIKEKDTLNSLEDIDEKIEVSTELLKQLSEQEYNYLMKR